MIGLALLIALLALGGVVVVLLMMRRQSQRIDEVQQQVTRLVGDNAGSPKARAKRSPKVEASAAAPTGPEKAEYSAPDEKNARVQVLAEAAAGTTLDERARRAFQTLLDTARDVFDIRPSEGNQAAEQEQRDWIENHCIPRLDGPVETFVRLQAGEDGRASRRVAQWYEQLLDHLGVRTIPVKIGQTRFDGLQHNAVLGFADSEYPEMTIIEEIRRGYEFVDTGKVIRKADVRVAGK
ncbi:MAG: nucleotide exchange factor GrpE [Armatimonadota bacterium]